MTAPRLFQSLQARMLALSAVATLMALGLAGWAIVGVLERFVIEGLDRRLDAEVTLLASTVDTDGRIDRPRLQQNLGTLEAGRGWRWRIVAPGQTLGSADFPQLDPGPPHPHPPPEGADADRPPPPLPQGDRLHPLEGADDDGEHIHARAVTIRTRRGHVVLTAAAPRAVISRPIRAALAPLLMALAALAVLLGAASIAQLRLGLRPLRRLRDQIAGIRSGERTAVEEDQPTELRPLAVELNQLAEENRSALSSARQSAANLAHALKTPVSALALKVRNQPECAAQVARIDATIRHHLARARSLAVNRRTATPLASAIDDLVTAIVAIHEARNIRVDIDVADTLSVAIDAHDLDEMIGNLLDNAARHATSRVVISASVDALDARRIQIDIADDGPGIAEHDRPGAIQAGARLDERGDGHGFGLSIVSELVLLYGGGIDLLDAPGGGLLVRMSLPSAGGTRAST